jgi:glycosyltransferase involved in cell wall biosynthesis
MKPACSVVIPTYNRRELLGYTLNALVRQTLPRDQFEVVVVDDGSSDDTADVAKSFTDRLNLRYFYREDEGYTACKARNLGIAGAEADICVLLDCGVLGHSGLLAAHLDSHRSADGPTAVCGYAFGYDFGDDDARRIKEAIDVDDVDGTIQDFKENNRWPDVREVFYTKYGDSLEVAAPWMNYWTCNVSARTDQLRRIGMFDEDFRSWGAEDIDIGYRLYLDGAKIILNRDAVAIHYPHGKSQAVNDDAADANYRRMVAKYGTPIIRLLLHVPNVNFYNINDVIAKHDLPSCIDYLAHRSQTAE